MTLTIADGWSEFLGLSLLGTSLILDDDNRYRYEKLCNASHTLAIPVVDEKKRVVAYTVPITEKGKASKRRPNGDSFMIIRQPEQVMLLEFLLSCTRKIYANAAIIRARGGTNFWDNALAYCKLFRGGRIFRVTKPESAEFTTPVFYSLAYIPDLLSSQLPWHLRSTKAVRYLQDALPNCKSASEVTKCLCELSSMMETSTRYILSNYVNYILATPAAGVRGGERPVLGGANAIVGGMKKFVEENPPADYYEKQNVVQMLRNAAAETETRNPALSRYFEELSREVDEAEFNM